MYAMAMVFWNNLNAKEIDDFFFTIVNKILRAAFLMSNRLRSINANEKVIHVAARRDQHGTGF